ncbi:glycosyltransferase family 2 protein [Catalinimonas niigatensis]|uniref:glycosyltransferase family 2 protein n=1 Tax=Catalinimonas niigatensis TaxID=1397264 RepID=UPI002666D3C8|nr:glycosyltransferase [Catalinimonas niigatensis]WPP48243.1 glycosyltransferase [Catalinimonas niigatensis]
MKELVIQIASFIAEHLIFFYAIVISLINLLLAILSIRETRKYIRNNKHIDDQAILSSTSAPSISLLVPMYNEEINIIDSVRSLLSLQYNNYNVIVINDGSIDNSLRRLVEYFQLIPLEQKASGLLPTRKILGVYKSRNRAFGKLIVIDKLNGGKADALNAGLNISDSKLVATMDADSIISPDSLLKMVRPFLQNKVRVIATGAIVRIANSCKVEDGSMVNIQLSPNLLARFQTLEYLRVFLLSRIAWSRLNGLLIISGAFGLFDKEIAIKAGGYANDTVGEDMELVVRMRRYMQEIKQKYKVFYIPDPLCWTEAPSEIGILGRQRNRWARGTAETLYRHRKIFFNPRYGLMGMLSYPYWFFFEYLAPYIEVIGLLYFVGLLIWGTINWTFFLALLAVVYTFAVFMSVLALIAEEFSYHKYNRRSDTAKLVLTAFLDPVLYHPIILFNVLKGYLDLLLGKKSWGNMKRKGFRKNPVERKHHIPA